MAQRTFDLACGQKSPDSSRKLNRNCCVPKVSFNTRLVEGNALAPLPQFVVGGSTLAPAVFCLRLRVPIPNLFCFFLFFSLLPECLRILLRDTSAHGKFTFQVKIKSPDLRTTGPAISTNLRFDRQTSRGKSRMPAILHRCGSPCEGRQVNWRPSTATPKRKRPADPKFGRLFPFPRIY